MEGSGCSERHACQLVGAARSSVRYQAKAKPEDGTLSQAIQQQAEAQPSYGYRRIAALLRRQGWTVNVKRVHRLWQRAGLQIPRRKVVKRRASVVGEPLKRAEYAGHVWTYDFMTGRTESGRTLRILNILDEHTREALAMVVAPSMGSRKVLEVLDWLFLTRGAPTYLRSDNGPEFIAQAIRDWLHQRRCQTLFITPGSPWENPFIESFNGHFRAECLDRYLFANVREAQDLIDSWRIEYNHYRPHSSLGYRTPAEFAAQEAAAQQPPAPTQHSLSL